MRKYALIFVFVLLGLGFSRPAFAITSLLPAECTGNAYIAECRVCTAEERATVGNCCPEDQPAVCQDCPLDQPRTSNCCCNLSSVEALAFNIAQIVLGVSGSLALLMFVIGGFFYIFSGGEGAKVKKATSIITNAVIGLAIILFAGVAIKLLVLKLTGS
jgi:hypothetical protein